MPIWLAQVFTATVGTFVPVQTHRHFTGRRGRIMIEPLFIEIEVGVAAKERAQPRRSHAEPIFSTHAPSLIRTSGLPWDQLS